MRGQCIQRTGWKRIMLFVAALELLILLAAVGKVFFSGRYAEDFSEAAMPIRDAGIPLEKGYYEIEISYSTDEDDVTCQTKTGTISGRSLRFRRGRTAFACSGRTGTTWSFLFMECRSGSCAGEM